MVSCQEYNPVYPRCAVASHSRWTGEVAVEWTLSGTWIQSNRQKSQVQATWQTIVQDGKHSVDIGITQGLTLFYLPHRKSTNSIMRIVSWTVTWHDMWFLRTNHKTINNRFDIIAVVDLKRSVPVIQLVSFFSQSYVQVINAPIVVE